MKSYSHFCENERFFIETAYNIQHKSIAEIANALGKNKSSVYREIKRNSVNGIYIVDAASKISKQRFWHCHSMYLTKYKEFSILFKSLYKKQSHGVYVTMNEIKRDYPYVKTPSTRQVFRGIKSNRWVVKINDRLRNNYQKGGKRKNGFWNQIFSHYIRPLGTRPREVDTRKTFGHGECDLIIGKQLNGFKNILTFNERKTRMLFACFVTSKLPGKINSALGKIIKNNNLLVKTITIDNGIEFEKLGIVAKGSNSVVYRCEPYASFQRGSNENLNGFIRRYGKKGTDFNNFTDVDLQKIVDEINNMPRKMFKWKSSKDLYIKELKKLKK